MTQMDVARLNSFLEEAFPQVAPDFTVRAVTEDGVEVVLLPREAHLRPGGTVSGPTLFALADVAVYLAILARIGPVALAVTTNASIDFLRKPEAATDLVAQARLLKLGKRLAVGDVLIVPEQGGPPLARASLTYSIPPKTA
ncbi:PaaI family thioesterase [Phaeovulum vinaykumarii]|uniref:Uncharacterized domain 1-containing protein n=1 Tax=Phaeovulum vinaykumarii TaxID=407234 RepID=A0A1N7M779_9RHOB|nr:PaaI family thioesterase [Phaeovulum vinaykumarii]SIS81934.1 uncharacterized domain 1-containing protein [Phaeovulum vinaykumarii]SOC11286.1 uncharacterized protein (TIGR00369 family) [Phaeovulum vinaykumarii]